jgi:hypothetical protein
MPAAKNIPVIEKNPRTQQFEVLNKLSEGYKEWKPLETQPDRRGKPYQITEIAGSTGSDEKEVQRSLYVLEGHKLVTPIPEGDFTSKTWQITETGVEALKHLKPGGHSL